MLTLETPSNLLKQDCPLNNLQRNTCQPNGNFQENIQTLGKEALNNLQEDYTKQKENLPLNKSRNIEITTKEEKKISSSFSPIINEFLQIDIEESSEDQSPEIPPIGQGWFANGNGTGPTITGYIYSELSTEWNLLNGTYKNWSGTDRKIEKSNLGPIAYRLENPGMMLNDIIVNQFLDALNDKFKFNVIHDFYLGGTKPIKEMTLDDIQKTINSALKRIKNLTLPLVIPICLTAEKWWSRNHLIAIIVKDGEVEYFDPKGVFSKYQKLKDENSLRNVLEYLCNEVSEKKGCIYENQITHQFDNNNCGVYCCHYIDKKIRGEFLGHIPERLSPLVKSKNSGTK